LLLVLIPHAALAAVDVVGTPFPSDLYTVADPSQLTGLRVSLPKPDCAARPSDCADIDVLNTLDGFNAQPRISVAFSGPIDPASVSSSSIFLVSLGCSICGPAGKVIGINQSVWEPAANTLHVESDAFLEQHSRYLLVVTRSVRGADGTPIGKTTFPHDLNFGQTNDSVLKAYRKELLDALDGLGIEVDTVAAASIFTTQSVTAVLEKIRAQIKAATPPAVAIHGTFPRATITGISWRRQTGTAPTFATSAVPIFLLDPVAVGAIAFGQFQSPDYENGAKFIPPVGTRTGVPAVQSTSTLQFTLILPAVAAPPGGYPVVLFGHGFTDSKQGAPIAVAGTLAANGLATIAINVVGHGGGLLGTLTVNRLAQPAVTVPDGGRGIDQDGNGTIDSTEGSSAVAPLIGNRDGLRQTVVDLMQLVRVIQTGGIPGLSRTRISMRDSRSAGSTARSCSVSSPTSAPACRTCPAVQSSRSRGCRPRSAGWSGSRSPSARRRCSTRGRW
jgi:hypothetical protein